MVRIEDYAPIVGQAMVDELYLLAGRLEGKQIQNINSTPVGGGVAEILTRMIPLLTQLGVQARWDVIKGNEKFFTITKKFHNGLHGVPVEVAKDEYDAFLEVNEENAAACCPNRAEKGAREELDLALSHRLLQAEPGDLEVPPAVYRTV
jgi:trehalose synthase